MVKLVILVLALALVIFFTPNCLCCPKDKKQALLQFKSSLLNATSISSAKSQYLGLESWNSSPDCCKWTHIDCNSHFESRLVISIQFSSIVAFYNSIYMEVSVPSTILTALFHIRSLKRLEMNLNNIQGEL